MGLGKGFSRRFPFSVGRGPLVSAIRFGCRAEANRKEEQHGSL